jgi:hypothetical protein
VKIYEGKPRPRPSFRKWDKVEKALRTYKSIEGDLVVPSEFIVPTDDKRWAAELWGMKLGMLAETIRNNNAYADHKDELVSMGFDFDPQANFYGWELSKKALLAYLDIHGDLLVNYRFTVPIDDERWAPELWKIKLGYVVNRIRNRNAYSEHKAELIEMGFDFEPLVASYVWEASRKALLIYKQIHGNLLVPYKFTVPSDDDRWTSDLWDMKLGRVVNRIRNSNDYSDHMDELVEMVTYPIYPVYILSPIYTIYTIHTIHAIHAIHTIHTIHTIYTIHTTHTLSHTLWL